MNQASKMRFNYVQSQISAQEEPQILYYDNMYYQQNQPPSNYNIKGTEENDKIKDCQIGTKLRVIQETFATQIRNLKQHNQYLLDTIKKLKMKNREQKSLINTQSAQIEKITKQKNVYKEKFLNMSFKIANNQPSTTKKSCNIINNQPPSRVESQYFLTFASDVNNHHDLINQYQLKQNLKDNIKRTEESLKELHQKQQQLMKQYHDNPGVETRKKCVLISKQIKKIEAQRNKNKNQEEQDTKSQKIVQQSYQSRSFSKQSRPTYKQSTRARSQCKYNN